MSKIMLSRESLYVGMVVIPRSFTLKSDENDFEKASVSINCDVLRRIFFTYEKGKAHDIDYKIAYPVKGLNIAQLPFEEIQVIEAQNLSTALMAYGFFEGMNGDALKQASDLLSSKASIGLLRYKGFSKEYVEKLQEYCDLPKKPSLMECAYAKKIILRRNL